ncbi:MAG: hypothetical protein ACKVS6_07840 [Planctomycetota bacterium]
MDSSTAIKTFKPATAKEQHNSARAGNVTKRVSLDPLAKTDHYKLVIPFSHDASRLAKENLSRSTSQ